MDEPQAGKKYQLSNLFINSIGLVRRGANKSPFFFVKSKSGQQGETMSDQEQEVQVETLTTEEIEAFRAWMAARAEEPAAEETEEEPTVEPGDMVDFAEMLATEREQITDEFTAKLETERAKTANLEEAFAESQRLRRLREFTDTAATYSLPVSGTEQFGEDLMAISDALPEVYGRLTEMLRASDEAISQGALFEQFSHQAQPEGGDPFMAKVTSIKNKMLESDPHLDSNEAFRDAMQVAQERHPDLATKFAQGGA